MAGDILDPDQAMAYLDDWQGRVTRMAADTETMSARLGELRVTAQDANGLAEVTIDSGGALVDVQFSERIQRVAPEVTARAVMSATTEARRIAASRSREIVTATLGDRSEAGRTIADQLERRLLDD